MSASELSRTLQKKLEFLFKNEKITQLGKAGTRATIFQTYDSSKKLRTAFSSAKSGQVNLLTQKSFNRFVKSLEADLLDESFKVLSTKMLNKISFNDFIDKEFGISGSSSIELKNVRSDKLKQAFLYYLETKVLTIDEANQKNAAGQTFLEYVNKAINDGHLAGIFSAKYAAALGGKVIYSSAPNATYRDFNIKINTSDIADDNPEGRALLADIAKYEQFAESTLKLLLDADFLTSNLIDEIDIFTKASKGALADTPYFTLEMQGAKTNQDVGDLLIELGDSLNAFISQFSKKGGIESSARDVNLAFRGLLDNIKPVADLIGKQGEILATLNPILAEAIKNNASAVKDLGNTFVNTPGSLSIKQYIAEIVKETIKFGKIQTKLPKSSANIKNTIVNTDSNINAVNKIIKTAKSQIKKLQSEIGKIKKSQLAKAKSKPRSSVLQNLPPNLLNLKQLLDIGLIDRVKQNMGKGNRKDILNLRSGRFAESVRINRLTQNKDGAVSAFYTYMRNPYDTFSEGGKQSRPRSRDPKLLISKSIREIAQELKITRLRAIST